MSWLRVFSAVLAANLATAAIFFLFSIFVMAGVVGMSATAVQNHLFGGHVAVGVPSSPGVDTDALRAMNEQIERHRKENEQRSRKLQLERENQQNAHRINQETCNFWKQQVRDNPNPKNTAYRDSACSRL